MIVMVKLMCTVTVSIIMRANFGSKNGQTMKILAREKSTYRISEITNFIHMKYLRLYVIFMNTIIIETFIS